MNDVVVEYRIIKRAFLDGSPVRLNDGSRVVAVIGELTGRPGERNGGTRTFELLTERVISGEQ